MTNTNLLNETIKKSGYKKAYLANYIGLTPFGLTKKIRNQNEFKASEIEKLCKLLNIQDLSLKERIFFANNGDFRATKCEEERSEAK